MFPSQTHFPFSIYSNSPSLEPLPLTSVLVHPFFTINTLFFIFHSVTTISPQYYIFYLYFIPTPQVSNLFYMPLSGTHHSFPSPPPICLSHHLVLFSALSIQVTFFQLALSFPMNVPDHIYSFTFLFMKRKHFTLLDAPWTNSLWKQPGQRDIP